MCNYEQQFTKEGRMLTQRKSPKIFPKNISSVMTLALFILICGIVGQVQAYPIEGLNEGLSLTYVYRGNNLKQQDDTGIFTTDDIVTAQFTVDCSAAHSAGDCANLPYHKYLSSGAVMLESVSFSAGPARLPTADGRARILVFSFSTDELGSILDWDMDLSLPDPSGLINVDTDNGRTRWGFPVDSASALGGKAANSRTPGKWTVTPVTEVPEPSTTVILLTGLSGILLSRLITRRFRRPSLKKLIIAGRFRRTLSAIR
jgi:hypothetical protein